MFLVRMQAKYKMIPMTMLATKITDDSNGNTDTQDDGELVGLARHVTILAFEISIGCKGHSSQGLALLEAVL